MPSPWMLSKKSITGETNRGFVGDVPVEEAIQSKALPWRREDEIGPGYSKVQEEFPAWINNKEYLPYASPTNTLMGKFAQIGTFIIVNPTPHWHPQIFIPSTCLKKVIG